MSAWSTPPVLVDVPEELHGPRVLLRPYREEDAPSIWDAVQESRDEVQPWVPWFRFVQSEADVRVFVIRSRARWMLRDELTYGIFEREDGRHLGEVGMWDPNWELRSFELGYWLRTSVVGHGYMRESVQLVTRMLFERLGANRVEVRMIAANARSRNVPARLGFVHEATLRRSYRGPDRQPTDDLVFALVPEDYERLEWGAKETSNAETPRKALPS